MKVSKDTIIRTILLIVAVINQALVITGKQMVPFTDEQIYTGLSMMFTAGTSLLAWWKNNSFTDEALKADKKLKEYKSEGID